MRWLLALVAALLRVRLASPQALADLLSMPCPNLCSGRGHCDTGDGRCACYEGSYGADCSLRECPTGVAWADDPTLVLATDGSHNLAECGRRGMCDTSVGNCLCDDGWEGAACERKSCSDACNGAGRCVTMEYYATTKDPGLGHVFTYESNWDAEMLYGCDCDPGFSGYDCSIRDCPSGDDPLTSGGVTEQQNITCTADGGTALLGFGSSYTTEIAYSASAAVVAAAISALRTITSVEGTDSPTGVEVTLSSPATSWCSDDGTTLTTVEFLADFGWELPLLQADSTALTLSVTGENASVGVGRLIRGSKEADSCSNRGLCDTTIGVCECTLLSSCGEDCWATSDGYGNQGARGDCGYAVATIDDCPGEIACSGLGHCDTDTYRCECQDGYTGADCSLMTCAKGASWFGYPSADDTAHFVKTECSDGGLCNREFGECECDASYEGAACDILRCPGDIACSGHGECLSMSLLAQASTLNGVLNSFTYGASPNDAERWDWDTVRGCLCNDGWTGHDCSQNLCPFGDDPLSTNQNNEVQLLNCDLDAATDTSVLFTFREDVTAALNPQTMSLNDLKAALEELYTIESVELTLDVVGEWNGTQPACSDAGQDIYVHFHRPTGDVPLIEVSDTSTFSISEYTQGTKEQEECSGRGLCDRALGVCSCFPGYGSSDGQGNHGPWADCGHVIPAIDELQDRAFDTS